MTLTGMKFGSAIVGTPLMLACFVTCASHLAVRIDDEQNHIMIARWRKDGRTR